jgi:choice-of-anchor A domain-containing protein
MISFNNFISNYGDVEGRLAVKNTALIGWGYSVGYELHSIATDQTLPYSLVVGGTLNFGSGAIYPDGTNVPHAGAAEKIFVGTSFNGPDYLGEEVTGTCATPGCLDSAFDALQACYGGYQSALAAGTDNVDALIQWSGLYLTCQSNSASTYYVTLQAADMSTYTWIDIENCNSNARWVINIPGTDDVTFSGGSFPENAASVIYNVQGSGRTIRLRDSQLVGTLVAPYNSFSDVGSVVIGKVIAGDITTSHQTNRAQCFTPSVPAGTPVASK